MKTAGTLQPLRMGLGNAAELLNISIDGVRKLIDAKVLTPILPNGRGRGKRMYVYPGEVEVFATEGLEGVVDYRRKQAKRKPK